MTYMRHIDETTLDHVPAENALGAPEDQSDAEQTRELDQRKVDGKYEQTLAKLFHSSEWTQQRIADKVGGAKVTQWVSVTMIASALGVAYYMKQAYQSETPQDFFLPFFLLFLVLFAATGVGNGSTFRTIAIVFDQEQAGPVLGWTSAVAAYGAFVVPQEFGEQINNTTPEIALYAFAAFYVICLVLNWWYYLGPKAEFQNP